MIGSKPLRIRFDKINEIIRIYDGARYLTLFGTKTYDAISEELDIIKIDFYDSLPIEKTLTLHNVIILIKSVLNKDKNQHYYKIFWEKYSNQLVKK